MTVPFHDCDAFGVVWHGRFIEYFAKARCALLKTRALDISDIQALGYAMMICDLRCRFNYPIRYNDRVAVTAWFSEMGPVIRISYEMRNLEANRIAARGWTRVALTANGVLVTALPDVLVTRLPTDIAA
jgi:acyl-CoA thioester hydrolase